MENVVLIAYIGESSCSKIF